MILQHCNLKTTAVLFILMFDFALQNDVHLIKKDEKVGASEATLLTMLKILPFSYGLVIEQGKGFSTNITYGFEVLSPIYHTLHQYFY